MVKPSDYTLVDVVADVFSGVSTAIGKVKDVAHQALNAVKAGLQYIANAVILLINQAMKFVFDSGLNALLSVMSTLFPNLSFQQNSGKFQIFKNGLQQIEIGLELSNLDFDLTLNQLHIKFGSMLFDTHIESLSINPYGFETAFYWASSQALIGATLASVGKSGQALSPGTWSLVNGLIIGLFISGLLLESQLLKSFPTGSYDQNVLKDRLATLHFGMGLGILKDMFKDSAEGYPYQNTAKVSKIWSKTVAQGLMGSLITVANDILMLKKLNTFFILIAFLLKLKDIITGVEALYDAFTGIMQGNGDISELTDLAVTIIGFGYLGTKIGKLPQYFVSHYNSPQNPTKTTLKLFNPALQVVAWLHLVMGIIYTFVV